MNFGTPTPAFYLIVAALLVALIAGACGVRPVIVFLASLFGTYFLFIAAVGGFARSDHFAMAAGVGVLIMIPTSVACAVVTGLGMVLNSKRISRKVVNKGADDESA